MSSFNDESYGTLTAPAGKKPEAPDETPIQMEPRVYAVEIKNLPASSVLPETISHYRIIRLLGEGGMGKVFEAEDTKLQRVIALKVMLPEISSDFAARERFSREARAVAAVRNDHVVTIYEVDEADGVPFLAMEFLHGQTLEGRLRAGKLPDFREIVRIGREIASGLAAAKRCGLIHRDIKPANIWLEEPAGRVKILDFGLARPAEQRSELTRTGDVVGTPHYMAPEQARGEHVDGRGDLFSLGVVLYRMCTHQLPFRGNTVTAVLTALAVDIPSPIAELNAETPGPLAQLIMSLLEKDRERRPQSADQVLVALKAIEAGQLPSAIGYPTPQAQAVNPSADTLAPSAISNTLPDPIRYPKGPLPPNRLNRRKLVACGVLGLFMCSGLLTWGLVSGSPRKNRHGGAVVAPNGEPIRIGLIYSRTGTMAISERAIHDGVMLAVEEINQNGGVLGRPVEAVIEDGRSDESIFAHRAVKLIDEDRVSSIFGCWTSACRKAVMAVVEQKNHLLFYPVSYEGIELSANIIYGGSVPNQQILPALKWSYGFLNKKRWYLVGSDSIFAHAAHAVIRDEAKSLGSQITGEEYLAVGSTDVAEIVRRIMAAEPDLIINSIYGDANVSFFRELHRAGITSEKVPTLSFTISEEEVATIAPEELAGNFAAGSYFQSTNLPRNQEFIQKVQQKYGPERAVSDPMQTAYSQVHLWAQAVEAANSIDAAAIRKQVIGQQYDAPQGVIKVCRDTLHTIQVSRVGRIDEQGKFMEVFVSPQAIKPEPYPVSRSNLEWDSLLADLYAQWGNRWHNPGGRQKSAQ